MKILTVAFMLLFNNLDTLPPYVACMYLMCCNCIAALEIAEMNQQTEMVDYIKAQNNSDLILSQVTQKFSHSVRQRLYLSCVGA